jgi:tRNA (adenine22-N1)-methyltransferase
VLRATEAATVCLSGLGGGSIVGILSQAPQITAAIERLVLQPQRDIEQVRAYLESDGWQIVGERLLKEGGFYYQVIAAERGEMRLSPEERLYGPLLLRERKPLMQENKAEIGAGSRSECYLPGAWRI